MLARQVAMVMRHGQIQPAPSGSSIWARRITVGALAGALAAVAGCVAPQVQTDASSTPPGGDGSPSVSSAPVSPPGASESPSDVEEMDWGPLPPTNLDAPRDLSDPQFPQQVLTFELDSESGDSASRDAFYVDRAAGIALLASITMGRSTYRGAVESLDDPEYLGRTVCGHPTSAPDEVACFMVGADHLLTVGSGNEMPVEDVAEVAETLHDLL